jgi:bifunctional non-homologous end joining protein LigD
VRLLTRRGYDWSDRPDGISDFEALHSRKRNEEARLYAFDLLMEDGVDMRDETLAVRKLWLGKLLKPAKDGILIQ